MGRAPNRDPNKRDYLSQWERAYWFRNEYGQTNTTYLWGLVNLSSHNYLYFSFSTHHGYSVSLPPGHLCKLSLHLIFLFTPRKPFSPVHTCQVLHVSKREWQRRTSFNYERSSRFRGKKCKSNWSLQLLYRVEQWSILLIAYSRYRWISAICDKENWSLGRMVLISAITGGMQNLLNMLQH